MVPYLPLTLFPVAELAPGTAMPAVALFAAAAVVAWGLGGLIALELLRGRRGSTPRAEGEPADRAPLRRAA